MKLKKLLAEKKKEELYTIASDSTVKEAAKILSEHHIGALLVTDSQSASVRYVGIISEHDIIRQCCYDKDLKNVKVKEIMTKDMIVATVEDEVEYVMKIMSRHHIRHIPIIEDSQIAGLLSMSDIVESLYEEDEIHIRYLSDYMGGTYGSKVF